MTILSGLRRQTFASLRSTNFRRYITGQAISQAGKWMQTIAQSWLVLELTDSATAIGVVMALQTVPMLLVAPYGGVVADRLDKRRLMIALQALMGVQALILGILTVTGTVQLWHVYVLALVLGLNQCFENPTRQSFLLEMVGADHLRNAVSLQSVLNSTARMIGPAAAGLVIAAGGVGLCFLLNAVSFVAVVASLLALDVSQLTPSPPTARARGQLREGLAYVRRSPQLAVPLTMMALIGCFALEFPVILPVIADQTFDAGPGAYGFITAAMGAGSVVSGLAVAAWGRTGTRPLVLTATAFGALLLVAALAPNLWVMLAVMACVGACSVAFTSTTNSTLQLAAAPATRGRVMALFGMAFIGSTAVGAPIAGWVCQHWGGRAGLLLGALACLIAAAIAAPCLRHRDSRALPTT
ncbi:putative major facilitator superfamily transporter [Rhodococcus wratislaviensis NBRC 100605]|uniref:Putative major facilitator superfamily transporter n=2 Tax=Rhodococcus wratislaviensis TaxID=44752 RepID=X0Q8N7_RHOWR|nr:putative major facilitator superfamily transporter [Rhodococcus wratislaviensis NBRC 100605]